MKINLYFIAEDIFTPNRFNTLLLVQETFHVIFEAVKIIIFLMKQSFFVLRAQLILLSEFNRIHQLNYYLKLQKKQHCNQNR